MTLKEQLLAEGFEPGWHGNTSEVVRLYALCLAEDDDGWVCQYVGYTYNIIHRTGQHRSANRFPWNHVYTKRFSKLLAHQEELRIIRLFQPKFNIRGVRETPAAELSRPQAIAEAKTLVKVLHRVMTTEDADAYELKCCTEERLRKILMACPELILGALSEMRALEAKHQISSEEDSLDLAPWAGLIKPKPKETIRRRV